MLSHGVDYYCQLWCLCLKINGVVRMILTNRAIDISSILVKLFDSIIIKDQHLSLATDDLQFGFKENASTITCTQLLVKTIEYYNINNTDCYMLLSDHRCL